MTYKTIRKKTYNNVIYLAKVISKEKGYPYRMACEIALNNFDDDGFRWFSVGCLIGNLVTYEESLQRSAMHEQNMRDAY